MSGATSPLQRQRNRDLKVINKKFPHLDEELVSFLYVDSGYNLTKTLETLELMVGNELAPVKLENHQKPRIQCKVKSTEAEGKKVRQ